MAGHRGNCGRIEQPLTESRSAMTLTPRTSILLLAALLGACARGNDSLGSATSSSSSSSSSPSAGGSPSTADGGAPGTGGSGAGGTSANTGGATLPPSCTVPESGLDALPFCSTPVPVDSFELVEKWHHDVTGSGSVQIFAPPLVANLNDDNGDGIIDLCDTPDILLQIDDYTQSAGDHLKLLLLSGKDGSLEAVLDPADAQHASRALSIAAPAVFDLDGDGVPEILVTNIAGHVMALTPAGAVVWESTAEVFDAAGWYDEGAPVADLLRAKYVTYSAIAVADLDGDGSPEILVGMSVLDAHGNLLFQDPTQGTEYGDLDMELQPYAPIRPVAADLDGDGRKEMLFGHVGYHADGTELYRLPLTTTPGFSHVADFFGDGQSEVLVQSSEGLTLVSASGQVLWGPLGPHDGGLDAKGMPVPHPAALVDMDGDGLPEALIDTDVARMIYRIDASGPTLLTSVAVPPGGQIHIAAGPGAFDFRGLGADWIASDAAGLTLFDGVGPTSLGESLASNDLGPDFPVVADVDNDGSADVLVRHQHAGNAVASLVVYQDAQRRPSPARRIWNQWNYDPSAVREDGKLPAPGPAQASTFRVQSRLACQTWIPPE